MRRSWSRTATATTTAVIPSPSWISSGIPVRAASPTTLISRPIPSSFMTMNMGAISAHVPECIASSGRSWKRTMRLGLGRWWSVLVWGCDSWWYVVVDHWTKAGLRTLPGLTTSRRKNNTLLIFQFISLCSISGLRISSAGGPKSKPKISNSKI